MDQTIEGRMSNFLLDVLVPMRLLVLAKSPPEARRRDPRRLDGEGDFQFEISALNAIPLVQEHF